MTAPMVAAPARPAGVAVQLSLPLLVSQAVYRMRLTKHVLAKRGIADAPHVRAPLPGMDEVTRRDVDTMLGDLAAEFPLRR